MVTRDVLEGMLTSFTLALFSLLQLTTEAKAIQDIARDGAGALPSPGTHRHILATHHSSASPLSSWQPARSTSPCSLPQGHMEVAPAIQLQPHGPGLTHTKATIEKEKQALSLHRSPVTPPSKTLLPLSSAAEAHETFPCTLSPTEDSLLTKNLTPTSRTPSWFFGGMQTASAAKHISKPLPAPPSWT